MEQLKYSGKAKKNRRLFLLSSFSTSFYNNMLGTGSILMTSYLIYLGATAKDIGILAAIPSLTNVLQVFSVKLYERAKSRKKVVILLTVLQYIFFYLIIVVPKIVTGKYQMIILIGCFLFGNLFIAARGSGVLEWNNFFVPNEIKGKYYSNKNLLGNLVYIIISLIVGKILDSYDSNYQTYLILFLITMFFTAIEITGYLKVNDYKEDLINKPKTSLKQLFTQPLLNRHYRYFMLFSLAWNFARSMATPYYTFYSKTVLTLDYTYIALIGSITCLIKIFVANPFGSAGDKKGWRKLLLFAGMLFALTNIGWGFINNETVFLYPAVIILNGIFMIGTNITIFNLNIELTDDQNRLLFFGFNASITAVFSFIGPNIAYYLMDRMKEVNMSLFNLQINGYQLVFFISGILQGIFIYLFALYLKKMQHKE
ncbi:MAG: MFS transporter [Clostridia bacterium]|nr:MFS transporter [Clostridia bacterium]